ncbi:MAG: homoserine kinase [Planctomycetota bacterium]|jgi:homoserine kinase
MPQRLALRVPCSTSNLGPGFDFLGLCLGMFLEAEVEWSSGSGAHAVSWTPSMPFEAGDDLVVRALDRHAAHRGVELPALSISIRSEIPVGRGLGSSGAATACGLLIADAVANYDGPSPAEPGSEDRAAEGRGSEDRGRDELVRLALELEGHPDNGTASLLGGCTLSVPHEGGLEVVQHPVHPSLGFAVAWPAAPLFTEAARGALPTEVPFADAVENPRRLALLLDGLRTGDPGRLALGVTDRLHERFRRELIPGSDAAVRAAEEAGAYAACLSGAGSGLVAIGPAGGMGPIAAALAAPLEGGVGRAVPFVGEAPRVEPA